MYFKEEQEITVYSNEHGYFTRLARRNVMTDEWENAFLYVQFKKGTDIPNKTKILVNESWLSFYKSKEGKTVLYMFVNDFDLCDEL